MPPTPPTSHFSLENHLHKQIEIKKKQVMNVAKGNKLSVVLFTLLLTLATAFLSANQGLPSRKLSATNEDEGLGIGIDLGTTRSAVAFLKNEVPTIISVSENGRTVPSVVAFGENDQVWVGQNACIRGLEVGMYRNVKRILGTGGKIPPAVSKGVPFLAPSNVGKTFKKDSLLNQIHDATEHPTLLYSSVSADEKFPPEKISAHVLEFLKQAAEEATGKPVTRAVIGVPAYFHDAQREATTRAAELAGIGKVKLLREPEAAALAYGIGKEQIGRGDDDELVLVFDLGGGTFDVSMLLVGGGLTEIISTSGNAQLGGSDLDGRVAQHILNLLREHGQTISKKTWSEDANNAVIRAAEQIRIYLSNNKRVNLAIPLSPGAWASMETDLETILPLDCANANELTETGTSNSTHVICTLSRRSMERLCKEELQALLRPVREVAIMAGALLPGDSSPAAVEAALEMEEEYERAIREGTAFGDFYDGEEITPTTKEPDINPEMLLQLQEMNLKAAKKAQQKGKKKARTVAKQERKFRQEKRKLETRDTTQSSQNDRVKVRDGISGRPISRVVLVGGATRMPAIGRLIAALTGVVPQRTVNPDEAVALGCAVHAGVLDGIEGMGTVLNPMQAAILKAVAQQQGMLSDDFDDEDFDDDEFDEVEYY